MTLSIRTDRTLIRAGASSSRYLLVSYTAPEAHARSERLPINVALILDRSGSMAAERKFLLAREAVEQAMRMLRSDDRFTLVVYDEHVDVLTRSTFATPDATRRALDALRGIEPRGSTDLCAGWLRGCEQVAEHLDVEGVSRALLLTDGLANHGTTDPAALIRHAGELRHRGIATSTFGVGADFDERLLRDMAHEGGGHFYFIETPAQIPDLLTSELGEALEVVGRDVALSVTLPRGASVEPLNRFRHAFHNHETELRIELGDLVSGQEVRAVVRIQFTTGEIGQRSSVGVTITGRGISESHDTMSWSYASHAENDEQARDREVDREVATLYAARARAEATEANRHGDFERARILLRRTADRVRSYAGDDPELNALAVALRDDVSAFAEHAMSPMQLKSAFAVAEAVAMFRSPEGKAKRKTP